MKKTYIRPEMEIVEIQGQVLLAGSAVGANVYDNADGGNEVLAPETHYWEF